MAFETLMAGGPVLLAVAIAVTAALDWPKWLHYIWAAIAFLFGVIVYMIL